MYNELLEKLKSGECLFVRLKRGNTYRFGENNSCIIKINANQMWGAFLNENSIILVRNNIKIKISLDLFLADWEEKK